MGMGRLIDSRSSSRPSSTMSAYSSGAPPSRGGSRMGGEFSYEELEQQLQTEASRREVRAASLYSYLQPRACMHD